MTDQERAKAILPFVQAIADGRVLETILTGEICRLSCALWLLPDEVRNIRIRQEPEKVPLGPEDIKSTTQFHEENEDTATRLAWDRVSKDGIILSRYGFLCWSELQTKMWRTDDDGKTWHKCEKERTS